VPEVPREDVPPPINHEAPGATIELQENRGKDGEDVTTGIEPDDDGVSCMVF
jgi:hypothetical protein